MSAMQPTAGRGTTATPSSSQSSKSQRVLACVLCHQRKVKCDRRFPCANCIKSRAECVPATVTRRRARRLVPEPDLLERLRKYEELLQHNNIGFEPLHKDPIRKDPTTKKVSPSVEGGYISGDEQHQGSIRTLASTPSTSAASERKVQYEAKNFWQTMNHIYPDSDDGSNSSTNDAREGFIRAAWSQLSGHNIFLVLGSRRTAVPLSTLHPEPVQIFRLWQVYLDNVNPLLKVTHAPSLQGRIVEALGNLENINLTLEALLFSIYCMAITSLSVDACQTMFGSPKEELLRRYQFACQQALLNCEFLRTRERDCLTALYLYIVSVLPGTDPYSLSGILAIALRIARRLGLHSESISAKCSPFEAEMRRRLWWSLIIFDSRVGELSDSKCSPLDPTWDCRVPLNVNDSDLRPDMKEAPTAGGHYTEAIFAVVRSELGDCLRHSSFHLDFTNPVLKSVARDIQPDIGPEASELDNVERIIEDKYLKFCDPEIPIHFMSIWMMRQQLAKGRLIEYYARMGSSPNRSEQEIDAQVDTTIKYAFKMLECDTKIMRSPLTRGYLWLAEFHFQFPAYIHITQELRRHPLSKYAEQAWELMTENFEARFSAVSGYHTPLFKIFSKTVLPAWAAREKVAMDSGEGIAPPRLVTAIKNILDQTTHDSQATGANQRPNDAMNLDSIDLSLPIPTSFGPSDILFNMGFDIGTGGQGDYTRTGDGMYPDPLGQPRLDSEMNLVNWVVMNPSLHGRPSQ